MRSWPWGTLSSGERLRPSVTMALVGFWLLLVVLGREYTAAGASAAPYFQTLAALLRDGGDSISTIMTIVFCLGALMLYYLLYQSQLVPRWISIWGFIAILLNLATAFLMMFNLMTAFSTINMVMNFPIFLQEMVMAVWLIAKGFSPAALASLSAKTTTSGLRAPHRCDIWRRGRALRPSLSALPHANARDMDPTKANTAHHKEQAQMPHAGSIILSTKLFKLTIVGGLAFWVTSSRNFPAPHRCRVQGGLFQLEHSDGMGWFIDRWDDDRMLRQLFFRSVPWARLQQGDPLLTAVNWSLVALVIATILIDVPRSIHGPSDALYYFLIGLVFNAVRFLVLGIAIGSVLKRQYGPARPSGYSPVKGDTK